MDNVIYRDPRDAKIEKLDSTIIQKNNEIKALNNELAAEKAKYLPTHRTPFKLQAIRFVLAASLLWLPLLVFVIATALRVVIYGSACAFTN